MSKTRIRAVWGTAQSEYIKWICSSRMLIFLCALIFIDQFAVKPLVEISKQTGVKLGAVYCNNQFRRTADDNAHSFYYAYRRFS